MISFSKLKQSVSITTVLADKHLDTFLKKQGDRLTGPCPIHQGDNPQAFTVDLTQNLWHCFTQCGGGDVIELVRRFDSCSYSQVGVYLQQLVGHQEIQVEKSNTFRPFTRKLPLDAQSNWLRKKGITLKTAYSFEVGEYHYAGFLAQCVGVRLHNLQGQPIGYAGRRLNLQAIRQYGKWKFPKAFPKSQCLYNWHRIQANSNQSSTLVIVESPWDVMRLTQINIPSVALLGLHISDIQRSLMSQYGSVLLLLDGDHAGQQATHRLKKILQTDVDVKVIQLPTGCDPDDLDDIRLVELLHSFFS